MKNDRNIMITKLEKNKYKTREHATLSIFEYIESWYNTGRIHTTLQMSVKNFTERNSNQQLVA